MGQGADKGLPCLLHLLLPSPQLPLGSRQVVDALRQPGQLVLPLQGYLSLLLSLHFLHALYDLYQVRHPLPQKEEEQDHKDRPRRSDTKASEPYLQSAVHGLLQMDLPPVQINVRKRLRGSV